MLMLVTDLVRPHLHMAKNKMATIVVNCQIWDTILKIRSEKENSGYSIPLSSGNTPVQPKVISAIYGLIDQRTLQSHPNELWVMMVVDLWRRRWTG